MRCAEVTANRIRLA